MGEMRRKVKCITGVCVAYYIRMRCVGRFVTRIFGKDGQIAHPTGAVCGGRGRRMGNIALPLIARPLPEN